VWALALRAGGIVVGVAAAFVVADADHLGLGAALAVPVFGASLLIGVVLGERTLPRPPTTGVRTARLTPRRVRDYLPRLPTAGLALLGGALLVLLSLTTITGSPDDQGRPGRAIQFACPGVGPGAVGARTPWPGSFYSVPIVLTVLVTAVIGVLVLRVVVRRPHVDAAGLSADEYRRRTASTVVATLGLVIAVPLAGSAFFTAVASRGEACAPVAAQLVRTPASVLVVVAVLAIGWYGALLLLAPARRPMSAGRL
jgi:hypothetical protein